MNPFSSYSSTEERGQNQFHYKGESHETKINHPVNYFFLDRLCSGLQN
jgi:hypothetical protein